MKDLEAKIAAKYPEMSSEYEYRDYMKQKDLQDMAERKMELLNARFAKMGYEPLTEEEKGAFYYHALDFEVNVMRNREGDVWQKYLEYHERVEYNADEEYLIDRDHYYAGEFVLDEEDYFIDEE